MQVKGTLEITEPDGTVKTVTITSLQSLRHHIRTFEFMDRAVEGVDAFMKDMVRVTGDSRDVIHASDLHSHFQEWSKREKIKNPAGRNTLYQKVLLNPKVTKSIGGNRIKFKGLKVLCFENDKHHAFDEDGLI